MSERRDSPDPARWMELARGNLAVAETVVEQGFLPQAAHMAQQAAETALKGLVYACGSTPPKTHDLFALRRLIPHAQRARLDALELGRSNEWGVAERYPTDSPSVPEAAARQCVRDARAVFDAVVAELERLA